MNFSTFSKFYSVYNELINIQIVSPKENTRKFIERKQKYRGKKVK